jgi:gamma-glutamyltranspeptidase
MVGFWELHSRYGKLTLFQPAIKARDGFKVPYTLATSAKMPAYGFLTTDPTFKAVFAPNGTLLGENDTMYRPTYAETLDTIVRALGGRVIIGNVWHRRILRRSDCTEYYSGNTEERRNNDVGRFTKFNPSQLC